jgi:hypothetical protein
MKRESVHSKFPYKEAFTVNYCKPCATDELLKIVRYDPVTGKFFTPDGKEKAVRVDHRGYHRISVGKFGKRLAHRVAWALMNNAWPKQHIDHVDQNKLNNIYSNLRECSHNDNQHNQPRRRNNKSGFKGVCWMKSNSKWHAQICTNSKVKSLGFFTEKEDAARAYDIAALELHGEFAHTNFAKEQYTAANTGR